MIPWNSCGGGTGGLCNGSVEPNFRAKGLIFYWGASSTMAAKGCSAHNTSGRATDFYGCYAIINQRPALYLMKWT